MEIYRLTTTISQIIQYAFMSYPLQMNILILLPTNYIIYVHSNYKHSTKNIYYYRTEPYTTFTTTTRPTVNSSYSIQISGLTTTISWHIQYAFTSQPLQMTILIPSPTNYIISVYSNYKHFTNTTTEQNPKLHLQSPRIQLLTQDI